MRVETKNEKLLDDEMRIKVQSALNTATLLLGGLTLVAFTVGKLLDDDASAIVRSVFKVFSGAVGEAAAAGGEKKGDPAVEINVE